VEVGEIERRGHSLVVRTLVADEIDEGAGKTAIWKIGV
jgi:hypothetical protein